MLTVYLTGKLTTSPVRSGDRWAADEAGAAAGVVAQRRASTARDAGGKRARRKARKAWTERPRDPYRMSSSRESSTWISMFPRLGSSRLPKTSRFEAAVPVPMSTRPERVPSR